MRSKAWRAVVLSGFSPASDEPNWRLRTGAASTSRSSTLATTEIQGRAATPRAQRAQPCGWWSSGCVLPSFTRSELMRKSSAPSRAGSSVVAAITATTTDTAAQ